MSVFLNKGDLVKRIHYQSLFQEIMHALPTLLIERADKLSDAEVNTIAALHGNITMLAIALAQRIKSLYQAIPEHEQLKHVAASSYSAFVVNVVRGLTEVDDRLLKPPLARLFGDDIVANDIINKDHDMFVYIKMCGAKFLAVCEMPLSAHFDIACRDSFLTFMPYRTKNASYDKKQLIYFPIPQSPDRQTRPPEKWQLHYIVNKHHSVPLNCMAALASDRYKVFYEDVDGMIAIAKDAVSQVRASIRFRLKRGDNKPATLSGEKDLAKEAERALGFKSLVVKTQHVDAVQCVLDALTFIKDTYPKLGTLVNSHSNLVITDIRKCSSYDRVNQTLVINVLPRFHECKLAYIYAQAMDDVIAKTLYHRPNYLGSDYWYLANDDGSALFTALTNMYRSLTYQQSPNFVYSAYLLDGLFGKHFFAHKSELFARAVAKCFSVDSRVLELSTPQTGHAALLYPNKREVTVFQFAMDTLEANVPAPTQVVSSNR